MKFGCHAVLFANRILEETEFILKNLSETGFKYVEIGSRFFGTEQKAFLLDCLQKHGVSLSGMHVGTSFQRLITDFEEERAAVIKVAEFVADLPNKNVIMSCGFKGAEQDFSEQTVNKSVEAIEKIAIDVAKTGAVFNYHNHAHEFSNDAIIFNSLVKNAPHAKFALDTGWVKKAGYDPIKLIAENPDRFSYVHLRDLDEKTNDFVDLGNGDMDYPALLGLLSNVLGENGLAIVEYEKGEQDFNRYAAAYSFLKGLSAEV